MRRGGGRLAALGCAIWLSATGSGAATGRPSPQAGVLANLRIASLSVTPSPLRAGDTATVDLLLFNDSTRSAAGPIDVYLVHNRLAAQPRPAVQSVSFLAGDTLTEVSFEVPAVDPLSSPYTLYAMIDAPDTIPESNESDNTSWKRVTVCDGEGEAEQPDGRDNDCDGLVDEELGLPLDNASALRLLRELQRQAMLDSVPLVFRPPKIFGPLAVEHGARLQSEQQDWIGVRGGSSPRVRADRTANDPEALWSLVDWNGGTVRSGDVVSARSSTGDYLLADGCGAGLISVGARYVECERLFVIVAAGVAGSTEIGSGERGPTEIRSGDSVALRSSLGLFVAAEQGGGRELRADRVVAGGWETFTLVLDEAAAEAGSR